MPAALVARVARAHGGVAAELDDLEGTILSGRVTFDSKQFRRGSKWMGFGFAASGVHLIDPASDLYAKIGRAFVDAQLEAYGEALAPLTARAGGVSRPAPPLYFSCDTVRSFSTMCPQV